MTTSGARCDRAYEYLRRRRYLQARSLPFDDAKTARCATSMNPRGAEVKICWSCTVCGDKLRAPWLRHQLIRAVCPTCLSNYCLDRGQLSTIAFSTEGQKVRWACPTCHHQLQVPLLRYSRIACRCPSCESAFDIVRGLVAPASSAPRGPSGVHPLVVYVTRATFQEVEAKLKGLNHVTDGKGIYLRPVRPNLVYHSNRDCLFAHMDYEEDGHVVAFNSGVVATQYNSLLGLCAVCAGLAPESCDRCGGRGDLPQFRHVQNGICFKCDGKGYVMVREAPAA